MLLGGRAWEDEGVARLDDLDLSLTLSRKEEARRLEAHSPLVEAAYNFAQDALRQRRKADGADIHHPVEVAQLLDEAGFEDEIVAAGLLHDVIEDTTADLAEIERRFGGRVAGLVETMTDDRRDQPYEVRKAAHRERIRNSGSDAAAIFAADKLAKAREPRRTGRAAADRKQKHYRQSLEMMREAHPDVPFLDELDQALG